MARSLATADYSAATVRALLESGAVQTHARIELLDTGGGLIDDDITFFGATVEMNVDRAIKGSLSLDMEPRDDLLDAPFQYRLRPWIGFGPIGNDGIAWYPMGLYVWNAAARTLSDTGATANLERWSVTLGDQGHLLDASGPGLDGFVVAQNSKIVEGVASALARSGITDTSGLADDDAVFPEWLSYTLTQGARRNRRRTDAQLAKAMDEWWREVFQTLGSRSLSGRKKLLSIIYLRQNSPTRYVWEDADNQPETWAGILQDFHDALGWYSGWFDLEGRYRGSPSVELSTAPAAITYEASSRSTLLGDIVETPDLERIGNRVISRSDDPKWNGVGVGDLNDLIPDHPLAQRQIGFYVDVPMSVPFAANDDHLRGLAKREMYDRLSGYASLSFDTGPNPEHEAFDVVGIRVPGDPRFGDEAMLFHERAWSMDLATGTMTHDLRRLLPIPRD